MKLLIIYNPQAGNGRAKALLAEVERYLKHKQLDVDILLTERIGHAIDLVAETDLSTYDAIVASGGDGTLFEVVNGYYKNEQSKKPPIGLIPNGTGNAFMKELNLHKSDWKRAIDIIAQNRCRELDVGRFETLGEVHYFLNIVGMGFVTDVAEGAIPLKWMGNAAYTVATLQKLIGLKSQQFEIEVDGNTLKRDGHFVEVANSRFTGTTFLMAPKAELDDGLLDLVFLNKISRLKLLKLFTTIYDGSHIKYPEIEYIQAKKIRVIEEF
ncbi:MAG: diacylglycerol kinase family lipid kinase, partial [Kangiellaceae bacterium]|nr:diacylglycerol kinase family lipid kinase [Kangiellaceae bacterium]